MNADSINQAGRSLESFEVFIRLLFEDAPSSMSSSLFVNLPFASVCDFFDKVRLYFDTLSREDKCKIANSHPAIGAATQTLSKLSAAEQGKIGARDMLEAQEIAKKLELLNKQYELKYGHRYVVFVNGRSRKELIPEFEQRLNRTAGGEAAAEEELSKCLDDIVAIAKMRFENTCSTQHLPSSNSVERVGVVCI